MFSIRTFLLLPQAQRYEVSREELERAVEEVVVNRQKTGIFDINFTRLCDMDKAKLDAEKLFKAGEDRWGTDEDTFIRIFATKNFCHLRAVWSEYVKVSIVSNSCSSSTYIFMYLSFHFHFDAEEGRY